ASFPPLVLSAGAGVSAPRLVQLVMRMVARRRDDRPQSWEEVLAELWRSREEVSPLSETLARKRGTRSGSFEATVATVAMPLAQELERNLSREKLIGRVVLGLGVAAFLASLAFAVSFLRRDRSAGDAGGGTQIVVPTVATAAVTAVPAPTAPARTASPTSPASPASPASPTVVHEPTRAATARPSPTHTATHAAVARTASPRPTKAVPTRTPRPTEPAIAKPSAQKGILELSLSPAGELDEVRDAAGKLVGARRVLPAQLDLPAGRYTVRLVSRGLDCSKTVAVTVRAGKTTSVKESCIEVK
ncbi:MAG: hypothetical protein ABIT01_12700, partial [Thermoanaerobaculia bacterium]